MIGAVPPIITDAGVVAGAVLAVIAVLTAGVRSPVGKWVVQNIRDDLDRHRRTEIREVLDEAIPCHMRPILYELQTNSGGSMKDHVMARFDRLERAQDEAAEDRQSIRRQLEQYGELNQLGREGRIERRDDD